MGDTRLGTPGEIWLIPTPWVTVLPDAREFVKGYRVSAPGAADADRAQTPARAATTVASSASRKRRFSSGVPIVTRTWCGNP